MVIRLDPLEGWDDEFPLCTLAHVTKVGDLVDLVQLWLLRDQMPRSVAQGQRL